MQHHRLRDLQAMAEIWTSKVDTAKTALDQKVSREAVSRLRARAEFRQAGLCLVGAKEQIEYLTASSNLRREEAYERYALALDQVHSVRFRADLTKLLLAYVHGEPHAAMDPEFEAAEQAVDTALLSWCSA